MNKILLAFFFDARRSFYRALSNLLVMLCGFTMSLAYIIATLALFIGWIKNIFIIATKPWLKNS